MYDCYSFSDVNAEIHQILCKTLQLNPQKGKYDYILNMQNCSLSKKQSVLEKSKNKTEATGNLRMLKLMHGEMIYRVFSTFECNKNYFFFI